MHRRRILRADRRWPPRDGKWEPIGGGRGEDSRRAKERGKICRRQPCNCSVLSWDKSVAILMAVEWDGREDGGMEMDMQSDQDAQKEG